MKSPILDLSKTVVGPLSSAMVNYFPFYVGSINKLYTILKRVKFFYQQNINIKMIIFSKYILTNFILKIYKK